VCDDNRLHRARVDRGIALADIAARTALNPITVQAIDAGRFTDLPAGIYARSYVRAFASAVGLEPEQVLRELEPSLPRVDDPLPVLRDIARGAAPDWPERMSGWGRDAAAQLRGAATRMRERLSQGDLDPRSRAAALLPDAAALRAVLAPVSAPWLARSLTLPGPEVRRTWRPRAHVRAARCAAACFDAAVLLLLLAAVVQLTAWTSGARVQEVLAVAGEQIAAVWGVLVLLYFVILGGVGGGTPGAVACGVRSSATDEPLRLRTILERAMLH
jgi:hypothetical protein